MDIFLDAYTWVTFSFVVFLIAVVKFGGKAVLSMLDGRIATIAREIETAERLRAEAHALVLEFEQRQRDAQAEADKMVATAREQADAMRVREEVRMEEMLRNKEAQLNARLSLMRDQAIDEIRQVAATLAFEAAEKMVAQKLDADTRNKLVERALDQVMQRLN